MKQNRISNISTRLSASYASHKNVKTTMLDEAPLTSPYWFKQYKLDEQSSNTYPRHLISLFYEKDSNKRRTTSYPPNLNEMMTDSKALRQHKERIFI